MDVSIITFLANLTEGDTSVSIEVILSEVTSREDLDSSFSPVIYEMFKYMLKNLSTKSIKKLKIFLEILKCL